MNARSIAVLLAASLATGACIDAASEPTITTAEAVSGTVAVATSTTAAEIESLVAPPVRHPVTGTPIYFVMTDRFDNGDPANDTAGVPAAEGPLVHGFLPEDRGFHHGGDLAGLTDRLDYIAGLGMEAIWITPPFVNRTVQGDGTIEGSSSGYHGYWIVDWTRIDPHLGSAEDMIEFIEAAGERGIDVYFDVVMNHTGDVITYEEESFGYVGTGGAPYLTADGEPFDLEAVAGADEFPPLDAEISFPYTPTFADEADAEVKAPDWLDDPTVYHNRGNSTFQGESSELGDFFGLDDLFTEDPRVVEGMIELYSEIIATYPIAGFRVDTVKHVNDEFWAEVLPALRMAAESAGREDFFIFAEVFSEDPIFNSAYSTTLDFSSTLDFLFDAAVRRYVLEDGGAEQLARMFDEDDWLTDADSNASMSVKFLGNHDMGRVGYFATVAAPGADDGSLLARLRVAYDLLFTSRGVPVVFSGDEQGFTGSGGDQLARQSMFGSTTPEYLDDDLIGTDGTDGTHGQARFDPEHPLYRHVAGLADLREAHPALETGAQRTRLASGASFAFSRIHREELVEYAVATNAGGTPATITFESWTPDGVFAEIHPGEGSMFQAGSDGTVTLEVAPSSTMVVRADRRIAVPETPVALGFERPSPGTEISTPRYRLEASVSDDRHGEMTFSARIDGGEPVLLGVDDAAPYRVYWNTAPYPDGAAVEVFAVFDDFSGTLVEHSVEVTLGERR